METPIKQSGTVKKSFLNNVGFFIIIGFIAALTVFQIAFALPPNDPYDPGETLDPGCAPGSLNCTVNQPLPITTEFATNTVINMYNYSLNWGPDFIYFDTPNKRVGIGTTAPSQKLDVAGNIKGTGLCIGDDCRISWPAVSGGNVSTASGTPAIAGTIAFFSATSTITSDSELYWDSINKRLGVSTSNPQAKVDIAGDLNTSGSGRFFAGRPVTIGTNDNTNVGGVSLQGDPGGWAFGYHAKGSAGTDWGGFGFAGLEDNLAYYYVGVSKTDSAMTILPSGNVGIGAANPSEKLEVAGNIKTNGLCFGDGCKFSWQSILGAGSGTTTGITSSDNIPEGVANLYFSDARARNSLSGSNSILYDKATGVFSLKTPLDIQSGGIGNSNFIAGKFLTFDGAKIISSDYDAVSFSAGSGVIPNGAANQFFGMNVAGDAKEWKTIEGTSNQINVSHTNQKIILSTSQDLHVGASPLFSGLTIASLSSGSIPFATTGGAISQDNANLFWDNVNKRLGIGTNNPQATLHVNGALKVGQNGTDIRLFKIVQATIIPGTEFSNAQAAKKINIAFSVGTIPAGALCTAHPPADLEADLMVGQCQVTGADSIAVMVRSNRGVVGTAKIWKFSIIQE